MIRPALALLAALALASRPFAAEPGAFPLVIKNGAMTQGDGVPDDWTGKFGDIESGRDTQVFKATPASLRVTADRGKSGQAFQQIKGGAGAKVRIAGWIKSRGSVKAQAVVQAFAEGFKQNQFMQLAFVQGETDWAQFEKEVQLPEWTAFFNVGLMVEGDGEAWLDEVREATTPVDAGKPMTEQERMTSAPPAAGKPWEPGWGFYPQFPTAWQAQFQGQLERTKKGGANVVFIGDSITIGWVDAGKAEWAKRFEPLGAVDYGIGGDSTRQVLWRIGHGLLDGLAPKLVVLKIGTNNLYGDHNAGTDEEIARGVETVVKTVREKLPKTRVLLLGILPRQNEFFSSRIQRIDALLAKFDDGRTVRFLDLGAHFQKTPGKGDVLPELFNDDRLHLSPKGYEVFADALQPLFNEMMKLPPW